jgi:FemAB-related protein (PEP-CTERM system-associated)
MIRSKPHTCSAPEVDVLVHPRTALPARMPALAEFVRTSAPTVPLSKHPAWLSILHAALGHEVYAVEAVADGRTHGFLPLAHVSSMLFGRFLVSLPYLNTNGVVAASPDVQARLVGRAVALAEELNVRYLELRHERPVVHSDLHDSITSKVHMRLQLPHTAEELWKGFCPKVRNQVRKGQRNGFAVGWGGEELVDGFYDVLCRNMRDLGTPVFGKRLFHEILAAFPDEAEICLVRDGRRPVAAALLIHGWGITEVPTAAALKEYNPTCANMMMYWRLLERSVRRGQRVFDFGRSTTDGNTFKYKKQWGAVPHPAVWQYCARDGGVGDLRPDNPRFRLAIRLWQQLPVPLTRYLGPPIVRGIP